MVKGSHAYSLEKAVIGRVPQVKPDIRLLSTVNRQNISSSTTHNVIVNGRTNGQFDDDNVYNKENDKEKSFSVLKMFRYADKLDIFLLLLGSLAALVQGAAVPMNFLVYGDVLSGFIYYTAFQENATTIFTFNIEDYKDVFTVTRSYVLYFCLLAITVIVFGFIQYACWSVSCERQMQTIRTSFFHSVVHHDIGWFDTHDAGELRASFSESMHAVEAGIGRETSTFIQWFSTCIGSYVIALIKGWKLTLACMAFAPLLMFTGAVMFRKLKNIAKSEAKAYSRAGSVGEEVLSSIKTVMAFNGQDKECKRYKQRLDEASSSALSKGFAIGIGIGAIWFFMYCIMTVAFAYGTKLMASGELGFEPGNVMVIFMGVLYGSMAIGQAFPILETIANAKAAAAKIYATIDSQPLIDSSSKNGLTPNNVDGNIELRNVSFNYPARPDVQVLKGLNIIASKGQTVALVGPSGCGKSTVVQLVERFYDVDSGQVLLDGQDIRDLNVDWLRKQIGLVSQEPILFGTTIMENIRYGRAGVTDDEVYEAARNADIHDFISSLPEGYNTFVGERGTQLSGGQKQRVAIARAIVRIPTILLLDEATSALDNESETIVQKALDTARKGRTTLIIAHRLSTIKNADLIIVIADGMVVEQGTHDGLMKTGGLYQDMVKNQTQHDTVDEESLEVSLFGMKERGNVEQHILDVTNIDQRLNSAQIIRSAKNTEEEEEEVSEEIMPKFSMKRALSMNSPEWYYIAVGCLFAVIVGGLQPSLAYLLSEYLKVFTMPPDEQDSFSHMLTGIILGIAVFNTIIRIAISVCFVKAGSALTMRLRILTFQAFLRQDMSFFDNPKNRVGILTTRLSTDATLVQGATGSKIGYVIESGAVLLAAVIISFLSSWKLALVVLAILPFLIGAGVVQAKLNMSVAKSDKSSIEDAGQLCSEVIGNIKLVASLTKEDTFLNKYNTIISSICRKAMKRALLLALILGISNSMIYFTYAAAFTYGAFLIQYEGLDFNLVIRVLSTIILAGMHIGRNSAMEQDFTKAKLAAARLFGYIDTKPEINIDNTEGTVLEQMKGFVEFRDVNFHYPTRPDANVLRDMAISICPGETLALVGASGCGKSTTVALLERFYDTVSGSVVIDNEDVKTLNLISLRSHIGIVSQEPILFDCSIADNISYGDNSRMINMDEIIQAARSANIHDFITLLPKGYDTNVGNKGTQLSGGQKQRIAIARALISNPRILLLDEATSALDSQSEQVVQEALDHARKGRTCIVIAHRLSTIQNADKIAIIHKGTVIELGTHSELIAKRGVYYKLCTAHDQQTS